jgi:hypothetical protein
MEGSDAMPFDDMFEDMAEIDDLADAEGVHTGGATDGWSPASTRPAIRHHVGGSQRSPSQRQLSRRGSRTAAHPSIGHQAPSTRSGAAVSVASLACARLQAPTLASRREGFFEAAVWHLRT